jgi:hypothetical protein
MLQKFTRRMKQQITKKQHLRFLFRYIVWFTQLFD